MLTTGIFGGDSQHKTLPKISILVNQLFENVAIATEHGTKMSVYRSVLSSTDLNAAQCLTLALVYSLSVEDIASSLYLTQISTSLEHLNSKYLKLWLLNDYIFEKKSVVKCLITLGRIISLELIQIPRDLINIFSALAEKFNVNSLSMVGKFQFCQFFDKFPDGDLLDNMLCKTVETNSIAELFLLANRGANLNLKTSSGDSLYHLAVTGSCIESIKMLGFFKTDIEVWNKEWETPILKAVMADNDEVMRALLSVGAVISSNLKGGNRLIHIAASHSKNKALEVLLESGAILSDGNQNGETPLLLAVKNENLVGVKLLLKKGGDPNNLSKEGESLLHISCRLKCSPIIKKLINAGAKSDAKNRAGLVPLHLCQDRLSIEALYSRGVSLDLKSTSSDSALHLAVSGGYEEVVEALINLGATLDIINSKGETPLILATKNKRLEFVKMLLCGGADPNAKDDLGSNAAFYAAEQDQLEILHFLMAAGADMKIVSNKDFNILHIAVLHSHNDIVEFLLNCALTSLLTALCKFEDWKYCYNNGNLVAGSSLVGPWSWTALHLAAFKGHFCIVKLLIQSNASVNVQDSRNWTPLHLAACGGHLCIVETLLIEGADILAKTSINQTACHIASDRGHLEVLKVLIKKGIDVNGAGFENWSPLHHAVAKGHLEVVRYLLDNGANINSRTTENYTPLSLSVNTEVSDLLRSRGGT